MDMTEFDTQITEMRRIVEGDAESMSLEEWENTLTILFGLADKLLPIYKEFNTTHLVEPELVAIREEAELAGNKEHHQELAVRLLDELGLMSLAIKANAPKPRASAGGCLGIIAAMAALPIMPWVLI